MRDEYLRQQMEDTVRVVRYIQDQLPLVREIATLLISTLRAGRKLLMIGNGGSALEAQHFAAELVGHFRADRMPLPALALTADGGALTAIANDYDYESVFSRQVRALGQAGDILIALSTSGNSPNVLAGLQAAREIGMITMGLAGNEGGKMRGLCDHEIFFPFPDTARIQEGHLMLVHLICEHIDEAFTEET